MFIRSVLNPQGYTFLGYLWLCMNPTGRFDYVIVTTGSFIEHKYLINVFSETTLVTVYLDCISNVFFKLESLAFRKLVLSPTFFKENWEENDPNVNGTDSNDHYHDSLFCCGFCTIDIENTIPWKFINHTFNLNQLCSIQVLWFFRCFICKRYPFRNLETIFITESIWVHDTWIFWSGEVEGWLGD